VEDIALVLGILAVIGLVDWKFVLWKQLFWQEEELK
jgi:hypothetical protein